MLSKSICCEQQLLRSRRNTGARPAATSHTSLHEAISSILQMKPRHKNSSGLLTASVAQMQKEMEAECPPDKLTSVKRNWGKALGTAALQAGQGISALQQSWVQKGSGQFQLPMQIIYQCHKNHHHHHHRSSTFVFRKDSCCKKYLKFLPQNYTVF